MKSGCSGREATSLFMTPSLGWAQGDLLDQNDPPQRVFALGLEAQEISPRTGRR